MGVHLIALKLVSNQGFLEAHDRTAEEKLRAIKAAMNQTGASSVTFVGHSLGVYETRIGSLALIIGLESRRSNINA